MALLSLGKCKLYRCANDAPWRPFSGVCGDLFVNSDENLQSFCGSIKSTANGSLSEVLSSRSPESSLGMQLCIFYGQCSLSIFSVHLLCASSFGIFGVLRRFGVPFTPREEASNQRQKLAAITWWPPLTAKCVQPSCTTQTIVCIQSLYTGSVCIHRTHRQTNCAKDFFKSVGRSVRPLKGQYSCDYK